MVLFFRLLGFLPLTLNQQVGALLGWLGWWFSSRHRQLVKSHLAQFGKFHPGFDIPALYRQASLERGKGFSELAIIWTAPIERLHQLVVDCQGLEYVTSAKKEKKPIIFVTPHLGCYDIAGRYLEQHLPVLALYRTPKLKSFQRIMQSGRDRGNLKMAPADASGVRALLRALKQGENVLILPDQVPAKGEGVWSDFFGRPAYTMTLLPRLAANTGAVVLFFFAERLPQGKGYRVHIVPMPEPFSADREAAARQTNAMVESLIALAPAQYLWGYNRYKHPAGAPLPPAIGTQAAQ